MSSYASLKVDSSQTTKEFLYESYQNTLKTRFLGSANDFAKVHKSGNLIKHIANMMRETIIQEYQNLPNKQVYNWKTVQLFALSVKVGGVGNCQELANHLYHQIITKKNLPNTYLVNATYCDKAPHVFVFYGQMQKGSSNAPDEGYILDVWEGVFCSIEDARLDEKLRTLYLKKASWTVFRPLPKKEEDTDENVQKRIERVYKTKIKKTPFPLDMNVENKPLPDGFSSFYDCADHIVYLCQGHTFQYFIETEKALTFLAELFKDQLNKRNQEIFNLLEAVIACIPLERYEEGRLFEHSLPASVVKLALARHYFYKDKKKSFQLSCEANEESSKKIQEQTKLDRFVHVNSCKLMEVFNKKRT